MRTDRTAADPTSTREDSWHVLDRQAVFDRLSVPDGDRGLSTAAVVTRQREYGLNRLPQRPPTPVWQIFLRQFESPLIYVLAVAAGISVGIGEWTDAAFIAGVLLINAVIAGVQEYHAERGSLALQRLVRTRATVRRDGEVVDVDGEEVVPGETVFLESGNRVPADVRLLSATNLEVDESTLTGESVPVLKDVEWTGEATAPLGDRRNVAFAGTTVTRGRARGIVVDTGTRTVIGRLARDVTTVEGGDPPLVRRMERFTRVIGVAVLVAAVLAVALGVFVRGFGIAEMFFFAVALAVSAIPEGLPVSLTAALGAATRRMARAGVIVRQLVAVEGLGSCTLIATDKTGTLTENELTVRRVLLPDGTTYDVTGTGYTPEGEVVPEGGPPETPHDPALEHVARAAVLCNEGALYRREDGWGWRGDPTDIAFLAFARKLGWERSAALDRHPELGSIPFEPDRRYAASFHGEGGDTRVFVKGAPEQVLAMCDLSDADRRARLAAARSLAAEGYRVLAVADGDDVCVADSDRRPDLDGLTFRGFLGMIDPLRPGVTDAIATARSAGIAVSMVTGDHPETALVIARDLGLAANREEVLTGSDLAALSDETLRERIGDVRVFARVAPEQKLRIVRAAQAAGHFVAVTGDGVNDAPALQVANIGIAMGQSGTDVARDTAELILSDDNFATIVAGIEQGRVAFDNVRKVIYLLVSTGAAEVVLVLSSLAAGLPLPLLPVQLLWLNLVTNGIQDIALAFEPKEGDVLDRPPRSPNERIFDRLMVERTVVGALTMGLIGLLVFEWLLGRGWSEPAARNGLLLQMVLFETVQIGNSRSETRSILHLSPLRSPILLVGATAAFTVHVAALYVPAARRVLQTAPVGPESWAVFGGLALFLALVMELHKVSWRLRRSD